MPITVRQLHPLFVGEVRGVDVSQALDEQTKKISSTRSIATPSWSFTTRC